MTCVMWPRQLVGALRRVAPQSSQYGRLAQSQAAWQAALAPGPLNPSDFAIWSIKPQRQPLRMCCTPASLAVVAISPRKLHPDLGTQGGQSSGFSPSEAPPFPTGAMLMTRRISIGSRFEARVASLIRSSPGYKNVREQQHIRGKDVDLIFQKQWNPHKLITIAIECKDWATGINRSAVQEIFLDYKPLLDAKDIDELWIVTPKPVSATVQEYADSFSGLEVLHINEFEQGVIDFSLYTEYLRSRFYENKLDQYYIHSRLEKSKSTLHDKVLEWINGASSTPIAVWAGYGMGKTSYATFLASTLAEAFLADHSNRIPILIPLGDYYTSPRIDGLFSNVLTNEYGVHGYNFNTFWNLHEAGRFVIILDGFDEMKHAMTRNEFNAISKEIRKLILSNSKIILLGRPDAIISDEEHTLLIKGTRRVSGLDVPDTIGAEFTEFRLDFFSDIEYIEFLKRYISAFYDKPDKVAYLSKRLAEIKRIDLSDILRRPVQARMLAQILLNPANAIEKISKYDLYSMFIEECLSREAEKHERQGIETSTRRRFMQDLAWWLWAIKRTRTFTITDIPPALSRGFIAEGQDKLGQLREHLVGSIVEERSVGSLVNEKSAGTYYFPHMSFTEFLVAEYLVERQLKESDVAVLANAFDGEIRSFLSTYNKEDVSYKFYNDIKDFKGGLPWDFVEFISSSQTIKNDMKKIIDREVISVWQFAIEIVAMLRHGMADKAIPKCVRVVASDQLRYVGISVQLLCRMILMFEPASQMFRLAANSLLGSLFRGINVDKLADSVRSATKEYRVNSEIEEYFIDLLSNVRIDAKNGIFTFSIGELYHSAIDGAERKASFLEDGFEYGNSGVDVKITEVRRWLRTKHDQSRFDNWLRAVTQHGSNYVVIN